jgi:hypothetical protein
MRRRTIGCEMVSVMALPRGLPLSVLDTAAVSEGMSVGEALRNSIDLARQTERLGYTRFWVAEQSQLARHRELRPRGAPGSRC